MKIEPGLFYKSRNGGKIRIYAQENTNDGFSVHGAILIRGRWEAGNWYKTGERTAMGNHHSDIVDPWTESKKPEKWAFIEEEV